MAAELVALGGAALTAGLLARGGRRLGLPTIPFFMAAGILLGPYTPGIVLVEEPEVLELIASVGLIFLLFHLGVEFPVRHVVSSGSRMLLAAFAYIGLNVTGGLILGYLLGWGTPEALVVAGAVGISSSAIVTKLLIELRRLTNRETPVILGIIVVEDLFLAFYLALLQPFLGGAGSAGAALLEFVLSFGFILLLLGVARYGARAVGVLIGSEEDELLTVLFVGLAVLVAGLSETVGVSDAIGALMVGLVVGQTAFKERVERLVLPLRDAFAALFFVVFGLSINVGAFGEVVLPVAAAVLLTATLNVVAGIFAARTHGLNQRAAANAGLTLLGRGEFSLILAALALTAGLDPRIGPFVALYVLIMAVLSPLLAARSDLLARFIPDAVMGRSFRYVRTESMTASCPHADRINEGVQPISDVCEDCVKLGDTWVHLRACMTCGYVGCCDDSKNHHARGHYEKAGHPIARSMEPGEDWRYCFEDERLV